MHSSSFWRGKRVLVTGHTGFKGGWLALWLTEMGAEVHGIALAPSTQPALHQLARIDRVVAGRILDIRDQLPFEQAVLDAAPQIVFHLAAQPLVRSSYDLPVETFATNVMGTAHLLQACRKLTDLAAVVVVTTDKVYENREWPWPYRETDPLGGKDPYSASKSAAELLTLSFRRSYFAAAGVPVLTARGGNVIGGGDWSVDRLVPDLFRAIAAGTALDIRAPDSVRPWQHVLTLCHGYLDLARAAAEGRLPGEGAWNFGPLATDCVSVRRLLALFSETAPLPPIHLAAADGRPEAGMLALDSSKARSGLGWLPRLELPEAVAWTAQWYGSAHQGADMLAVTRQQIAAYVARLS